MAAVFAPAEHVQQAVQSDASLSIAAYNGAHTVLSGPAEAVERFLQIDMPDEDKRKILWDNCAYYYGIQ